MRATTPGKDSTHVKWLYQNAATEITFDNPQNYPFLMIYE